MNIHKRINLKEKIQKVASKITLAKRNYLAIEISGFHTIHPVCTDPEYGCLYRSNLMELVTDLNFLDK